LKYQSSPAAGIAINVSACSNLARVEKIAGQRRVMQD
jgi:hypothetical protein